MESSGEGAHGHSFSDGDRSYVEMETDGGTTQGVQWRTKCSQGFQGWSAMTGVTLPSYFPTPGPLYCGIDFVCEGFYIFVAVTGDGRIFRVNKTPPVPWFEDQEYTAVCDFCGSPVGPEYQSDTCYLSDHQHAKARRAMVRWAAFRSCQFGPGSKKEWSYWMSVVTTTTTEEEWFDTSMPLILWLRDVFRSSASICPLYDSVLIGEAFVYEACHSDWWHGAIESRNAPRPQSAIDAPSLFLSRGRFQSTPGSLSTASFHPSTASSRAILADSSSPSPSSPSPTAPGDVLAIPDTPPRQDRTIFIAEQPREAEPRVRSIAPGAQFPDDDELFSDMIIDMDTI